VARWHLSNFLTASLRFLPKVNVAQSRDWFGLLAVQSKALREDIPKILEEYNAQVYGISNHTFESSLEQVY
jgi:hypothetical protein